MEFYLVVLEFNNISDSRFYIKHWVTQGLPNLITLVTHVFILSTGSHKGSNKTKLHMVHIFKSLWCRFN